MRRYLMVLVLAVLFSGCAGKQQVMVDGLPMPSATHVSRSHESNMRVEANFMRMIWEKEADKEKGKEYLYPADYLEINQKEVQELDSNTVYVGGTIRVVNPERKEYFVKAEYIFRLEDEEKKAEKIIYKGDDRDEVLRVGREVEEGRPEVECNIYVHSGEAENEDYDLKLKVVYQVKE